MYNSFKKVPSLTNCVTSHALYIFLSQMIIILHVGNACGILGETKCNLNSILFASLLYLTAVWPGQDTQLF